MSFNGLLLVLFLLLSCMVPKSLQDSSTASSKYYYFCDLSRRPIVTLYWNASAGEYQQQSGNNVDDDDEEEEEPSINNNNGESNNINNVTTSRQGGGGNRSLMSLLLSENDFDLMSLQAAVPATSRFSLEEADSSLRSDVDVALQANNSTDDLDNESRRPQTIQARICPCAESPAYPSNRYYCQSDRSYCAVPGVYPPGYTYALTPVCLNLQNDEIFVRSVWPIVLIWFVLAAVFCVCTFPGRNAIDCVFATCFPCYNKMIVNGILRQNQSSGAERGINNMFFREGRHSHQRRRLLHERYRILVHQHRIEDGSFELAERRLNEYELKTKRYRIASTGDDGDGNNSSSKPPAQEGSSKSARGDRDDAITSMKPLDDQGTGNEAAADASPLSTAAPSLSVTDGNDDDDDDHDDNLDDELDHTCTICFVQLQDGDKVGDLNCGHAFHVDCLKGWLKRRNVCPLCMEGNICTPRVPIAYHHSRMQEDQFGL